MYHHCNDDIVMTTVIYNVVYEQVYHRDVGRTYSPYSIDYPPVRKTVYTSSSYSDALKYFLSFYPTMGDWTWIAIQISLEEVYTNIPYRKFNHHAIIVQHLIGEKQLWKEDDDSRNRWLENVKKLDPESHKKIVECNQTHLRV